MRQLRAGFLFLLAGLVLTLLTGCGEKEASITIFAMDTVMTLEAWGDTAQEAVELGAAKINELDRLLSVNNESSDIWAINHGSGKVAVSQDTAALIETGLSLWRSTGGALNIAMYPVVRAWGFTTEAYRVVGEEERRFLLALTDLSQLALDSNAGTVSTPEGMELDLGSLGKGYAGDQVMALFRAQGVQSACISLGGNVHTLGGKPDGSAWRIAVQDPEEPGSYLGILSVTDKAVVTSGGYERFFEENGQIYWHIMDPETGAPADSGLISATVVGESGVLCDGLSTALFIMGAERAADYWRAHEGFDFLLVGGDHTIYLTEGLEDAFTLEPGYEGRELQVIRK